MNIINEIKKRKKFLRISSGLILILIGGLTSNEWFYLGVVPLIVGLTNFCPACILLNKCSINR